MCIILPSLQQRRPRLVAQSFRFVDHRKGWPSLHLAIISSWRRSSNATHYTCQTSDMAHILRYVWLHHQTAIRQSAVCVCGFRGFETAIYIYSHFSSRIIFAAHLYTVRVRAYRFRAISRHFIRSLSLVSFEHSKLTHKQKQTILKRNELAFRIDI